MAVGSETQGIASEEDKGGGGSGKEVGIAEGIVKGGGTTGIGHGEERKEGRREEVRSGGMEPIVDSVEEAWIDVSTGGEDEDNQVGSEEENGI